MNALQPAASVAVPEPLLQYEDLPDGSLRVVKTRAGNRHGVCGVWAGLVVSTFLSVVFARFAPLFLVFGWFVPLIALGCVSDLVRRYLGHEEWLVSPDRIKVRTRLGRVRRRKEIRGPARLRIHWVRSRGENGQLVVDQASVYIPNEEWDVPRLWLVSEVPLHHADPVAEVLASRLGWRIERTEAEPSRSSGAGGP